MRDVEAGASLEISHPAPVGSWGRPFTVIATEEIVVSRRARECAIPDCPPARGASSPGLTKVTSRGRTDADDGAGTAITPGDAAYLGNGLAISTRILVKE
ncbi:hypothetical protein [Prescottella agglutinans]|uniref:Uncharacterized protein n=1 Tax=Prescottella agglutinans TaxID=1644129 RepID=A0ABT6M6D5_9NOCA|nr:hypothetical protein [Prescottella agglutinans]MDH6279871.1 hypothetical protein [Prescottella agglutinans]